MSEIHTLSLPAPGGDGRRTVRVYVPPRTRNERFPVLYLWDGQNVFEDDGSFAGGWRVHELMDRRARGKRRAAIVVGMFHGGEERIAELAPFDSSRFGQGRADATLDWLTGTVKPHIDATLPTLPDRLDTLVGGSSMGGLTSLYAVFRQPQVFGRALVMSPSLWFAGGAIHEVVRSSPFWASGRLYLDAGAREGRLAREATRLAEHLRHRGLRDRTHLYFRIDRRGAHNEAAWRRRLPGAVQFLLKRPHRVA